MAAPVVVVVTGPDLDEVAVALHDAFYATEGSGLMGMDLWRSMATSLLNNPNPLLSAARRVPELEARIAQLTKKWLDATSPERFVNAATEIARTTTLSPERALVMLQDVGEKLDLVRATEAERDAATARADSLAARLAVVEKLAEGTLTHGGADFEAWVNLGSLRSALGLPRIRSESVTSVSAAPVEAEHGE